MWGQSFENFQPHQNFYLIDLKQFGHFYKFEDKYGIILGSLEDPRFSAHINFKRYELCHEPQNALSLYSQRFHIRPIFICYRE